MKSKHLNLQKRLNVKNYKLFNVILLLVIGFSSCEFQREIEITPRYFVIQVDIPEDRDICFKLYDGNYIGLLGGRLSNLYQKRDTLIAIKKIKKRETFTNQYYIIPLHNKDIFDPSVGIKGPLNKIDLITNGVEINQFKEIDIGGELE